MSLRKQAVSGVKWSTLSTIILALTALIKVSVLARFLDKEDFGLMALVTFVLGFTNLFMDMGLTSAILHRQNITQNEYSSLYWLNFVFSIFLFLIICAISPFAANFYSESELLVLIPLMGLSLPFSSLGKQFKTILQKGLKFKIISIIDIFTALVSLFVAIYLAIQGYGVYSLVYSALLQYLVSNLIFLLIGLQIEKGTIKFYYSFKATKPFLKIGMYQVGGQVVNYFNRDLDILIIGKFFGAELLGGYSLAKQLVFRPSQIINPILTRVASPILVKFQKDFAILKKNYLKLLNIVISINIPVYLAVILFASPIVEILYGKDYLEIITLVRILSIYMIVRAIGNPIGSLIIATGRTDLEFYWNIFTLSIMPAAIYIGAQFSLVGVALSITITMILLLIPSWWFLMKRLVNISLYEFLKSLVPKYHFLLNKK